MLTLNSNIAALSAQRRLANSTQRLGVSFERLSSGLRINRASDDAAGLAIADSLRTDTRLFNAASRNINDGLSMLNIAGGALDQQSQILQRLIEIAEQSVNGVYTNTQRDSMTAEYRSLMKEFGRLGDTTSFNGQNLLRSGRNNGVDSINLQVGISGNATSQISLATVDTGSSSGTINRSSLATADVNGGGIAVDDIFANISFQFATHSRQEILDRYGNSVVVVDVTDAEGRTRQAMVAFQNGGWFEGVAPNGISPMVFLKDPTENVWTPDVLNINNFSTSLDLSGFKFLSGEQTSAIEASGVETADRAKSALTVLRNRLTELSSASGNIGALESRLTTAYAVVQTSAQASQSAESIIRDADIAEESATLIRNRILQQAGAEVLAQANTLPSLALRLLQS